MTNGPYLQMVGLHRFNTRAACSDSKVEKDFPQVLSSPHGTAVRDCTFLLSATNSMRVRNSSTGDRRQLDYDRIASNFFALSENKVDRILYRRCNFSNRMIHCIDMNYPRREKLLWDEIVTRISLSLRPR